MVKSKAEKKRLKRKNKKKQRTISKSRQRAAENGWFYFHEANYFITADNMDKAVTFIKKAVKALPNEEDVLQCMGFIGGKIGDEVMEVNALSAIDRIGKMPDELHYLLLVKLYNTGRFRECLKKADNLLKIIPELKIKNKRAIKEEIKKIKSYCSLSMRQKDQSLKIKHQQNTYEHKTDNKIPFGKQKKQLPEPLSEPALESEISMPSEKQPPVPDIPITCKIDKAHFVKALSSAEHACPEIYDLALKSYRIRFTESFETLICLSALTEIQSFWYQEETAKKVLKQFRGRALLSDEVGLGKTVESLIVLTEYIKRGMVKTFIILSPAPLVSQWQQEMKSKFNLDVPSTDDRKFKSGDELFWKQKFVIASINQAKSKKNSAFIVSREYDMVIVDEAHHLKNRSTLNWKLVNSLKKKFILLLTATPVENNLMELYNLITLLKPGQLETATSFREKFMTRGDPTDPKNRELLKGLLNQVMIRNTRALAGINIPPRFARTIRIKPDKSEKALYERLEALIYSLNQEKKGRAKMIIKNLLAQAGSSPQAVEYTLKNMLAKEDYLYEHEKEIRAVVNLCRTTVDTPKNRMLLKLIKADKEKIIIFVKYKGTVEHLSSCLEWHDISFSLFHGSMNNRQKDSAIEDFKNRTKVLITTEIGGEGRNLQFCSRMINYDLPWNPMKIEQRIGRLHRIGQKKEVQIYNFCAKDSIEDYILDILDRKINMFEMVIGEIDMILGRIRGEKEFGDIVYDIWMNSSSELEKKKSFTSLGTKLKRAKTGYNKTRALDDKLFGDSYEL